LAAGTKSSWGGASAWAHRNWVSRTHHLISAGARANPETLLGHLIGQKSVRKRKLYLVNWLLEKVAEGVSAKAP
jgi:hypothetical protein